MKLRTMFNMHVQDYPVQKEEIKNYTWKFDAVASESEDGSESDEEYSDNGEEYPHIPAGEVPTVRDSNLVSTLVEPTFCVDSSYRPSDQNPNICSQ